MKVRPFCRDGRGKVIFTSQIFAARTRVKGMRNRDRSESGVTGDETMLRNRLNDANGRCDYLAGNGCDVAGQRGCVSMRSASFGKRMQRIDLPQSVIEQITRLEEQEHRTDTPATPEPATTTPTAIAPAVSTSGERLRRNELPSPIWASLVLGKA